MPVALAAAMILALWAPKVSRAADVRAFLAAAQPAQCPTPDKVFFDFQLERSPRFILDTTIHPRPSSRTHADGSDLVVQMIIDTTGGVDSSAFHVLKMSSRGSVDSARAALGHWRYSPAIVRGCKVRALIQAIIDK